MHKCFFVGVCMYLCVVVGVITFIPAPFHLFLSSELCTITIFPSPTPPYVLVCPFDENLSPSRN